MIFFLFEFTEFTDLYHLNGTFSTALCNVSVIYENQYELVVLLRKHKLWWENIVCREG